MPSNSGIVSRAGVRAEDAVQRLSCSKGLQVGAHPREALGLGGQVVQATDQGRESAAALQHEGQPPFVDGHVHAMRLMLAAG